jgi:hypothetical protein
MPHSPTPEQQSILDHCTGTDYPNLMINALAGTGKSATLKLIDRASRIKPALYLVFAKRNQLDAITAQKAGEFASTTAIKTFNGLGHGIWQGKVGPLTLDKAKSRTLWRTLVDDLKRPAANEAWRHYSVVMDGLEKAKAIGYVPAECKLPHTALATASDLASAMDERPTPDAQDLIDDLLTTSIVAAYRGHIDFNDQIYMPALFGGTFPRFPRVMVDEYQDQNPVNHKLVRRLTEDRTKLIGVGDPHQCHPPGTMIRMTGGGIVPIENLEIGQQVATYSTRAGRWAGLTTQGREVQNITSCLFDGYLIKVIAGDKQVKMTPNHKCVVRISREIGGCVLYLMKRDNRYRIGTSRVRYEGNSFGPALRARQEQADALWILDVYPDKEDAQVAEQAYSIKFGIPTNLFESWQNQRQVDSFWNIIGNNTANANTILEHFGRDINLPIWKAGDKNFIGFHRACEIHAANLVPQLMTMLVFPDGNWHQIDTEYEEYIGPVYGITVAPTEGGKRTYIADDILVHNSIYGFRGAKAGGMAAAVESYGMTELSLSVSFRCPQAIVEAARWRVPHFRWRREGGHVSTEARFDASGFADNSTIICRNNAPLLRLAFRLLGAGRSVAVIGSDLGPRLVAIMRKLGDTSTSRKQLLSEIESWREERLVAGSKSANDLADCMRVFAEHGDTLGSAISYAEHIFTQRGTIRLLTGHKSKGLEFDDVYFLDDHLLSDSEQDLNLRYVIQTRSQNKLTMLDSTGILW